MLNWGEVGNRVSSNNPAVGNCVLSNDVRRTPTKKYRVLSIKTSAVGNRVSSKNTAVGNRVSSKNPAVGNRVYTNNPAVGNRVLSNDVRRTPTKKYDGI
jgi:hypothetical protein